MTLATGWRSGTEILFAAIWIGLPGPVLAHAAILDRIAALDDRIARRPEDPALYLQRGELHRLHRDWKAALADYQRARRVASAAVSSFCRAAEICADE